MHPFAIVLTQSSSTVPVQLICHDACSYTSSLPVRSARQTSLLQLAYRPDSGALTSSACRLIIFQYFITLVWYRFPENTMQLALCAFAFSTPYCADYAIFLPPATDGLVTIARYRLPANSQQVARLIASGCTLVHQLRLALTICA